MKIIIRYFIISVTLLSSTSVFAAVPPPVTGGNPLCWPPPCVPVDNGLVFLIIAGISLVLWKLYSSRKSTASKA